jgi:hypothetical protein
MPNTPLWLKPFEWIDSCLLRPAGKMLMHPGAGVLTLPLIAILIFNNATINDYEEVCIAYHGLEQSGIFPEDAIYELHAKVAAECNNNSECMNVRLSAPSFVQELEKLNKEKSLGLYGITLDDRNTIRKLCSKML